MFLTSERYLFRTFFCIESVVILSKNAGKVEKKRSEAGLPRHILRKQEKDTSSEKSVY